MQFTVDLTEEERSRAFRQVLAINLQALWILRAILLLVMLWPFLFGRFTRGSWQALLGNTAFWAMAVVFILFLPPVLNRFLYYVSRKQGGMSRNLEPLTVLVNEAGVVQFIGPKRASCVSYYAATGVLRTKEFIYLQQKNGYLALLPLRVFESPAQAAACEEMMRAGIRAARANLAPRLHNLEEACLWRFGYPFDVAVAQQAVDAANKGTGIKLAKKLGCVFAVVGMLAAFVLLIFALVWLGIDARSITPIFGVLVFSSLLAGGFGNRARVANFPDYVYGPTVVEIAAEGVRVFNPQVESFFTWGEVTNIKRGKQAALLRRGSSLIAALPYHCAPPEAIEAALAFAGQHAGRN